MSILNSNWPERRDIDIISKNKAKTILFQSFINRYIVYEPYFWMNIISLSFITLIESSIALKLVKVMHNRSVKTKTELSSLAATNIISGIFGLVPASIPVSGNILVHHLGTTSPVYSLIAALLTIVFVWIIPSVLDRVPMLLTTVFNVSLGLLMIDLDVVYSYWRYNKRYFIIFLTIILMSLFIHIIFSMIVSWIIFFTAYFSKVSDETFTLGVVSEFRNRVEDFNSLLAGSFREDENTRRLLHGNYKLKQVLDKVEASGAVY